MLNVRRFEQRPTERLVFGELLDRRVTLVETGEEVTVLDLSVQHLPARRDWEIDRVFVRKGRTGGAFRRAKGETLTVDWSSVTGFSLEEQGQGAENLLATFEQLRPADLANVLHHLSPSAGPRSPPPSTTTASPTSSKSSPRTTRSRSSAS